VAQTLVTGSPAPSAAKSLPARIAGVIFAPRATYADVAARPRALGVLLFVIAVAACGVFAFMSTGFQIVALPLAAAVIAAIALAVFNALLGGDGTFKQAFAIVAHSGVVLSVAQLFGLPLAYARQTLSSATNLGVFAPFLDESSFAARLLGAIDLFIVWWMISLAIGLAVLYRKRTGPIAAGLLVLYVAIGIVIAAVKTAMSGA